MEFFAGIGLARMGLEAGGCDVIWSNDIDTNKCVMYRNEFPDTPGHVLVEGDMSKITGRDLPEGASIAWGSSPCTDLSLAGTRAGLDGRRSSAFWEYVRILDELGDDRPSVAVLENVNGLATSHGGGDLFAAIRAFNQLGYSVDILSIDGRRFVPQSRPRLFLIGLKNPPADNPNDYVLRPDWLSRFFGDKRLTTHRATLPVPPAPMDSGLGLLIEEMPDDDPRWWESSRVDDFFGSLSPVQYERVRLLRESGSCSYRTAYRRTRKGIPTWEIREDDISGCLRTVRGGSSRQAVVRISNGEVRVRWMTPLEYARLMGAGDYELAGLRDSQIMFGFGDAVCVPVVEWLTRNYLAPAAEGRSIGKERAK